MTEQTIKLTSKLRHQGSHLAVQINNQILTELRAGNPVYVKVPSGAFAGSIGRLKITEPINQLSKVLHDVANSSSYGPKLKFRTFHWELEIDGCSRKFKVEFNKFEKWRSFSNYEIEIYLGRTSGTTLIHKPKDTPIFDNFLIDMLGRKIKQGEFVLINPGPVALSNDEAVRIVQWTGKQSLKQGYFKCVQMAGDLKKSRDPGSVYRLGLRYTDAGMVVPGVKVDVDEDLTSSLALLEHDISKFKLKFSVGLDV